MKILHLVLLVLVGFSSQLIAAPKELRIGVGLSLPPYVIKENKSGVEYEIVNKVLTSQGFILNPVFVSMSRLVKMLQKKQIDGAMTQSEEVKGDFYHSDVYIRYQNAAITLQSNSLVIDAVSDLKKHRVLAFQSAQLYLGEQYRQNVGQNPDYGETPTQIDQNLKLFNGLIDIVIADPNIFYYFNRDSRLHGKTKKVKIFEIFPPTDYRMAFQSKALRDKFNTGLKSLKDSGEYSRIFEKYIGKGYYKNLVK